MSGVYTDYHFKFTVADCAKVVPSLLGIRNMLGEPFDAEGNAIIGGIDEQEPAFYGKRIGDDIFISFRSVVQFNPVAELTETTAEDAAAMFGVWA